MLNDESNSFVLPDPAASADIQLHFSQPSRPDFLSVVMPVYDDLDGLKNTLESLVTPEADHSRFEIIVANDGGDPAISDLCKRYGVKEVVIKPNGGSYNARNRGIEAASGEFVALIDADEIVDPGWMNAVFKALADADFAAGPVTMNISEKPPPLELYQILYPPCDPRPRDDMPNAAFFPTANVSVRRSVLEKIGGFDSRLRSGGDFEFSDRVTRTGNFRQVYSQEMKVIHPCRTYQQIIKRNRRTYYGQLSLLRLYPDRFRENHFPQGISWKLLFPDGRSVRKDVLDLKLDWYTFLRLFLLMWWMKIRRFEMLLSLNNREAQS
jgi:glycosyltransferase involved in cell wall biosynthesis